MKKFYFLLILLLCVVSPARLGAQVTTSPNPLQQSSADVKVFFHADEGNQGLMGVPSTTKVYAHTWAVLDNGQQVGAPNWNGTYPAKFQLTYVSSNLWQLYIGDINTFYGVPSGRTVKQLGFVFRNADASKTGRAKGDADIMVDVVSSGLQVVLQSSFTGNLITPYTGDIKFTAASTVEAALTISVNGTAIATGSGTQLTATYDFTTPGDYEVTASATAGGQTVTDTKNYCYVKASAQADYPGGTPKMGPVTNGDGSVTFCLGAPQKQSVMIVGAWNDYSLENDQVMNYTDVNGLRYFWITVPGIADGKMYGYYFVVDGETSVGDPYARLVLDPWNDQWISADVFPDLPAYPFDKVSAVPVAVYQSTMNDYVWKVKNFVGPAQEDLIVYELLFRDFTGTEGKADGNGTVRGAIEKFDYLKTLGVNAIELLPIMEFNGNNSWGYNPNFYFAVDKAYGTPDDYKEFIDLCHQNGMAVILDMVFNQSDGLHPWYQMYGGNQYSPFYNYGLGGENGAPHAYSVMNDWNQGYPLVQQQWKDVITYWLTEYHVDGFRFDLVKGLGLNESYANAGDAATNAFNQSRVNEMKYLQSVIQEARPGAYCINENLAGAQEENLMAADGELNWANVNNAGCQFAMGYQSDSNMNRLLATQDSRTAFSTVSYLESHDEERLAYKQDMWGVAGVKDNVQVSMQRCGSAAAQMIMTPGAHMIWMFGELGKSESLTDRTGPKLVEWNLLNEPNHKGLYNNYSEMIQLRFANPQFFGKDASFQINCGQNNWAAGRSLYSIYQDQELLTFVNPNVTGSITFYYTFKNKDNAAYKIYSQSYASESFFNASSGTVTVPANCYVVIGSADLTISGVESIENSADTLRVSGGYGEITIDNAGDSAAVYSLEGRMIGKVSRHGVVKAAKGIYVVKSGKESVKVVVR